MKLHIIIYTLSIKSIFIYTLVHHQKENSPQQCGHEVWDKECALLQKEVILAFIRFLGGTPKDPSERSSTESEKSEGFVC